MNLTVIERVISDFIWNFRKTQKREWREERHRRKCFTLGDVLALDPENAEALRLMAQMDRFKLRYKRWIVNETKVCQFADENKRLFQKSVKIG